ncbi:hypothetical protein [Amycolatopsis magusensis]|uniref:hypothetical protein n=1 Tax=Amycolatopsis magusensis TaxID=882444 RepID=UPI003C2FD079
MDDRQLETLFRDAPGEPPEPTFDLGRVTRASHRAKVRRRNTVSAVCGAVLVVLVGAGVITGARESGDELSAAAPASTEEVNGNTQLGPMGQPGDGPGRPPVAAPESFPSDSPMQGGETTGETGPRAEGTFGCDQADRELATALAGELPVPAPDGTAMPGRVCSTDFRSASFPVGGGVVSASVVPAGVSLTLATQPEGTLRAEAQSPTGATVLVLSIPAPGSTDAPFAKDMQGVADALAKRF